MIHSKIALVAADTEPGQAALKRLQDRYPHVPPEEAEVIVVGYPISMSGAIGSAARAAADESRLIAEATGRPVELFDERMTTVTADRALREAEISASSRRRFVDKVAAAVMLQAWLDRRKAGR